MGMNRLPDRCSRCQNNAPESFLHSRFLTLGGFAASVVMIYAVLFLSDRYFYAQAQKHFQIHTSEHFDLFSKQMEEGGNPAGTAGSITTYKEDLYLELRDEAGKVLYRTFRPMPHRSEYHARRSLVHGGQTYRLDYASTPLYDANHSNRHVIFYAVAGVIVHLFLLYIIVELLRSRALVKSKAAELESSRAWLDTILKSSVDGVHIVDTDGRLIASSPSFLELIGYGEDEARDLRVFDWEAKDSAATIASVIESISEAPSTRESLFRRKDGRLIDVETTMRMIREGNRRYIYASSRDIGERKRSEIALRHEKETAQSYLDIVDVMIVVIDTGGKILLLNRKGSEILGFSQEEVAGKSWIDLFIPERLQPQLRRVAESLEDFDGPAYNENPVVTKNGEERLIAWRNRILLDDEGRFAGFLSSGEDITEIRHAQLRLMESESFYKSMFSSLNEAILILDHARIIDCNAIAAEIFEKPREEMVGSDLFALFPDTECQECGFARCVESAYAQGITRTECSFRFADEHSRIIDLTLSRFGAAQENKLIVIARDITEKSEEERLFRMYTRQAQMGEMISMIAHQWRQPLAIINAITSQMRLKALVAGEYDPVVIENLMKIEEQSSHLSQTISDYRDFFRPDKPKEYFSVSSLLSNALSLIDHTLKNHSIHIETRMQSDPTLYTYRNEVLQVMMALLKNALDAFLENRRREGGLISLSVENDGDYALIRVRDNAGGIPAEALKKLFTPYFTTKQKSYGTGLGLYMSKIIIQEHCHGSIGIETEGEETTVTVRLPYHKGES